MRRGWLLLFSVVFLAAGTLVAQKITVDFDHTVNFGKYRTYAWLKPARAPGLWPPRITSGVTAELRAKGLTYNPRSPDLMVAAVGTSRTMRNLNTFYSGMDGWGWYGRGYGYGYGYGPGMGTGTATTTVYEYQQGTLVVDLLDGKTKALVWRGIATDTASGNPEKNQKKLNKALAKLFQKYPPKPKE